MEEKPTIVYVCTDFYQVAGSSLSLMNLLESVREEINPIIVIAYEGEVARAFREKGYEVMISHFFYMWEKKPKLKTLIKNPFRARWWRYYHLNHKCAREVEKMLGGRKVDIVHTNTTITTVGVDIARRLKAKHVWHIREYLDLDFHLNIYKGIPHLRKIINRADYRIAITRAIADHWRLRVPNTECVWNAVVCTTASQTISMDKDPYFLFCAAELCEHKGTDVAVRYFARSGVWKEGFCLRLVGAVDEKYKQFLIDIAQSEGMSAERLEFVGFTKELVPHYERATAFLMCSRFEGMGRVTVEAMFYGCPVIARNSGGTTDFVKDRENGYLFDNDEQLTEIIERTAHSDNSEMIVAAHRFAADNFSETTYGRKIMEIYRKVINNQGD